MFLDGDSLFVEDVSNMSYREYIMQKDERILQIKHNLTWLPRPNEVCTVLSSHLPPAERIATALVLAFDRDRLLQTRLAARGWDIVGGHIEPGESPEEAARREAYEEAKQAQNWECCMC